MSEQQIEELNQNLLLYRLVFRGIEAHDPSIETNVTTLRGVLMLKDLLLSRNREARQIGGLILDQLEEVRHQGQK